MRFKLVCFDFAAHHFESHPEITESLLIDRVNDVAAALEELSRMGLEISVIDFGTGYASLSYLKRLSIDKLKIDRSFVNELGQDRDDGAIVTAIVAMAHSLQMQVVAEGVEIAGQLAFLQASGCDQYQGYFFSKPVPASERVCHLATAQTRRAEALLLPS